MDPIKRRILLGGPKSLVPVKGVMSDPPTATFRGTGTTPISSAQQIAPFAATMLNINAIKAHGSGYYQCDPSVSMAFIQEWVTDAPIVDIKMLKNNSNFVVLVDDQPIQAAPFTTDSSGQPDILAVDFSATATPSKARRFTWFGINMLTYGFYVGSSYSVSKPASKPLAAIVSDSYAQGTGANGTAQTWARYCFKALGYDFLPEGVGSAGYLSVTTPASRITDKIGNMPVAPALVVLALGYNDAGGNQANIAASHAACVAASRALWPSVRVVTMGPWTPLGATAGLTTVKNTLMASAAANGSRFIDIENIINASNASIYTGPDLAHPTASGHPFLGAQSALRFRAARIYA